MKTHSGMGLFFFTVVVEIKHRVTSVGFLKFLLIPELTDAKPNSPVKGGYFQILAKARRCNHENDTGEKSSEHRPKVALF